MKLSHFKQVLKSCRGGVSMTVHRLPGEKQGNVSPSLPVRAPGRGRQGEFGSLSDYPYPSYQSYQAPGTPGSNLSETTGYYSTQSTSLPSVCSAAISPMGADLKTSQSGFENRDAIIGSTRHMKPSQMSTSQHSGYETDQTSFETSFQTSSGGGGSASNQTFPSRPNDIPPYTIRPLYSTGSNGNSNRVRMSSHSSYGGSSQMSSQVGSTTSPKPDAALSVRPPYPPPRTTPSTTTPPFAAANAHSFSVDRLENYGLPRASGDSHMTSLAPHSMSLSSVCRLGGGKRTNV